MNPTQRDIIIAAQQRILFLAEQERTSGHLSYSDAEWMMQVMGANSRRNAVSRVFDDYETKAGLFAPLDIPTATGSPVTSEEAGGGPFPHDDDGDAGSPVGPLIGMLAAACFDARDRADCGVDIRPAFVEVWHKRDGSVYPGRVNIDAPAFVRCIEDQIERLRRL